VEPIDHRLVKTSMRYGTWKCGEWWNDFRKRWAAALLDGETEDVKKLVCGVPSCYIDEMEGPTKLTFAKIANYSNLFLPNSLSSKLEKWASLEDLIMVKQKNGTFISCDQEFQNRKKQVWKHVTKLTLQCGFQAKTPVWKPHLTIRYNTAEEPVKVGNVMAKKLFDRKIRKPPYFKACLIDENYNYPGGDLRSIRNVKSAQKCAERCGKDATCKSWTYGKKQGQSYTKNCYLKSIVPIRRIWKWEFWRKVGKGEKEKKKSDCCDSGLPCKVKYTSESEEDFE